MSTAIDPDDSGPKGDNSRTDPPDRSTPVQPSTRPDRPITAEATPTIPLPDERDERLVVPGDGSPVMPIDTRAVVQRQREQFGGMKIGCCFFGWLAATGMAVLLTALLAATGAALGLTRAIDVGQATANPNAVGLVGGIVLLVVVFVAYFCGGYVAGRMARFHGARQGVGVWLWAVIIAVVIAILGLIAGTQFDVLARLNGFPRIPLNEGTLTTGGILTAIGVAVVSLAGATVGGLSGMRFHRRVDSVVESAAR